MQPSLFPWEYQSQAQIIEMKINRKMRKRQTRTERKQNTNKFQKISVRREFHKIFKTNWMQNSLACFIFLYFWLLINANSWRENKYLIATRRVSCNNNSNSNKSRALVNVLFLAFGNLPWWVNKPLFRLFFHSLHFIREMHKQFAASQNCCIPPGAGRRLDECP